MAAGNTVTIACKAPNGLVLNLDKYEKVGDQGFVTRIPGASVTLKGWARPWGSPDTTQGGYALNQVPADFWDEWWARNASSSSLIADKIILPPPRIGKDAAAQALDHAEVPQMFRPAREGDVPGVQADKAA